MRSERVVALIMAAGRSRRFGTSDKRLLRLPTGETLLVATTTLAANAFTDVRLVLRENDDPEALGLPRTTPVIRAPRADEGLGASLADAFTALGKDPQLGDIEAVAVLLADMPFIQADTLQALARQASADTILRPVHAGRPGNPTIFGRRFWPQMQALTGDEGGRAIIRHRGCAYREYRVDDAGIHADIDTVDDVL